MVGHGSHMLFASWLLILLGFMNLVLALQLAYSTATAVCHNYYISGHRQGKSIGAGQVQFIAAHTGHIIMVHVGVMSESLAVMTLRDVTSFAVPFNFNLDPGNTGQIQQSGHLISLLDSYSH